jgi:hypothetical protein
MNEFSMRKMRTNHECLPTSAIEPIDNDQEVKGDLAAKLITLDAPLLENKDPEVTVDDPKTHDATPRRSRWGS